MGSIRADGQVVSTLPHSVGRLTGKRRKRQRKKRKKKQRERSSS
jgi:hypothetical protein